MENLECASGKSPEKTPNLADVEQITNFMAHKNYLSHEKTVFWSFGFCRNRQLL